MSIPEATIITMINDELVGLELAKYILLRLVVNNESIKRLAEDFDNDVRFINGVIKFLEDVGWIKRDATGGYEMTDVISLKVSSSKIIV
jgi:predicted methyltransferase